MPEERSQPTGAYIFYTIYLFHTIYNYFFTPFGMPITYAPEFFIFVTPLHDPILRLHSQLPFMTHVHDPHSRLAVFATIIGGL